MRIKNYTSRQDPAKSANQIEQLLQDFGADKVLRLTEDGEVSEIRAHVREPETGEMVMIQIEPDYEATSRGFKQSRKAPNRGPDSAQVKRTAWKNEYEYLHLLLTSRAGKDPNLTKLLMDRIVTPDGTPLYDRLFSSEAQEQRRNLLPPTAYTA